MSADLAQARAFLSALDPEANDFTFQYFSEREGAKVPPMHPHGTLADLGQTLVRANLRGAGIFVTVNRTDGAGRTAANIVSLRSVFVDCDRPRIRPLALPPSLSVHTSTGRGHHYWLLSPGAPLDAFRATQERLAAYYGSDPAVTDLGRVLRLPGFWNVKREPFMVALVRCRPDLRYSIEAVLAAHPIAEAPPCRPGHDASAASCAEGAYRRWVRRAPLSAGTRNRAAFRLALEGFRMGLPDAVTEKEVRAFCDRAGIASEAASILRSAAKTIARGLRHSSRRSSQEK